VSCAFCDIVDGRAAADVVFSTEAVIAFLDRSPLFPGHVLVVPRRHAATMLDLDDGELTNVMTAVRRIASVLPSALGSQGSFVAVNNVVSQSVPHVHVHVVPRTKGDGLRGFFWPRRRYGPGESAAVAALLRDALS
jgi:histidine triad (HIT) family protein